MIFPNDDINIDTTKSTCKFPCNMAPVYRSLSIPDGTYTPYELIDYVNTNSSYSYNLNGIPSLSYTQFLAKVVDNDVVIYTNDNTEFFINSICSKLCLVCMHSIPSNIPKLYISSIYFLWSISL